MNTAISLITLNLKLEMPCCLVLFSDWLCTKRRHKQNLYKRKTKDVRYQKG